MYVTDALSFLSPHFVLYSTNGSYYGCCTYPYGFGVDLFLFCWSLVISKFLLICCPNNAVRCSVCAYISFNEYLPLAM